MKALYTCFNTPPPPPKQNALRDITVIDFVTLSRLLVCLPFDYVYIKKTITLLCFYYKNKVQGKKCI